MNEHGNARISARQYRAEQSQTLSWDNLADAPYERMLDFPITPESKLKDSVFRFPKEWLPAGNLQRPCNCAITLPDLPDSHNESLRRAMLALWIVPRVRGSKGVRLLAPTTFIKMARCLINIAVRRSGMVGAENSNLFKGLSFKEAQELARTSMDEQVLLILNGFGQRAILKDAPNLTVQQTREPADKAIESRKENGRWQPFSDEFVGEFGKRCLWLVEQAGPVLLDSCNSYLKMGDKKWRTTYQAQQIVLPKIFAEQDWSRVQLAFEWQMSVRPYGDGKAAKNVPAWPPQSWQHMRLLLVHLQAAHYAVVGLSTGARWSETASLQRNCLEGNTLNGKTFKMSGRLGGVKREWVLPEQAVKAIEQQKILASLYDGNADGPLWVQPLGGKQVFDMNLSLKPLVESMGLMEMAGQGGVHTHRWRKTIARLAALTIAGAPKALMDLFGHRSVETTLGYMLSDPEIAADIDSTLKAKTFAVAKAVLEESNSNTGQPAARIRSLVQKIERGEDVMGVSSLDEAAEILSDNGRGVVMVRPGVLCTKAPGDFGPCTKGRGRPDPARCSVLCAHRLETAAAQKDAQDALVALQEKVLDPKIRDRPMVLQAYQGQIRAHLERLKKKNYSDE